MCQQTCTDYHCPPCKAQHNMASICHVFLTLSIQGLINVAFTLKCVHSTPTNCMCTCKKENTRTKYTQLLDDDTVYANTYARMLMRHPGQSFRILLCINFGCSWQQSGEALHQPCLQHMQQGTTIQKPGNDAKVFGSRRQAVHKSRELSVFSKT